jgi:WD40 repeat protein
MCARHLLVVTAILSAGAEPRVDRYGDPLPPQAMARLGTVRFRHGGRVVALAYSPDCKTLAAASDDGRLMFWDADSGRERCRAEGEYRQLEYLDDGISLAALAKESVALLDPATGEILNTVMADENIKPWGDIRWLRLAVAPNGKSFAVGARGTIHLFDAQTGRQTNLIRVPDDLVIALAFAPDGTQLVSASRLADTERSALLWDLAANEEVRRYESPDRNIDHLLFVPNGKTLILIDQSAHEHCYDLATGREQTSLPESQRPSVSWNGDGAVLVVEGGSGLRLNKVEARPNIQDMHTDLAMAALRLSPDRKTLAIGEANAIRRFEVSTLKEDARDSHCAWDLSAAWSPDGKYVVTAASDDTLRYWEAATGRQIFCSSRGQGASYDVAFAPDGKYVAAICGADDPIRLFDFPSGRERLRFGGKRLAAFWISFAPDGKTLLSSGNGLRLMRWDTSSGKRTQTIQGETDRARMERSQLLYLTPCISANGRHIAAVELEISRIPEWFDTRIRVWEAATGQELPAFRGQESGNTRSKPWINRPAISCDGRMVAGLDGRMEATELCLWEMATGVTRRAIKLEPGHPTGVAIASDNRHVAAAVNEVIFIWDITTGREVRRYYGHTGRVLGLAFSPEGQRLLTWSSDNTALIWDVADLLNPQR